MRGVHQTTDGGYIIAGSTDSYDPDLQACLLKTDLPEQNSGARCLVIARLDLNQPRDTDSEANGMAFPETRS